MIFCGLLFEKMETAAVAAGIALVFL
jgi:hypothetical protein